MEERRQRSLQELLSAADRLEELADTAEIMGDHDGAVRFRARATQRRLEAMALLDET
jgi:hypothetical protein